MHCEIVRQELNAFIDDQLCEGLAREIECHLDKCAMCRGIAKRSRRLDDLISGTAAMPVPAGFAVRVLGAARRQFIRTADVSEPASPPRQGSNRVTPLHAVAAAVLALGLSLGTWMASQTWRTPEDNEDGAGTVIRTAQDIGGFYGAGADGFDAQRPLPQVYMALVDRNALGE